MATQARQLAEAFAEHAKAITDHVLPIFTAEPRADAAIRSILHLDAGPTKRGMLGWVMKQLKAVVAGLLRGSMPGVSSVAGKRAAAHVKREFARLGLPAPKTEPEMGALLDGWRRDNTSRMKGLFEGQAEKIVQVLKDNDGMRHESIAEALTAEAGLTAERAVLVARQQVLNLHGQITRFRQMKVGIEEFIWTTANDERVRKSHKDLDGKTFRWDDPPEIDGRKLAPGEDFNCRCIAFPVIAALK